MVSKGGLHKAELAFGRVVVGVGVAVWELHAAVAEALGEQRFGAFGHRGGLDPRDGLFDRVFDAFQLDASTFDHGISGTRVAIAGHADAARVEDGGLSRLDEELLMGVASADDVGFEAFDSPRPGFGVFEQIFVERVAWGAVDKEDAHAVDEQPFGEGEFDEVAALLGVERGPLHGAADACEVSKAGVPADGNPLGHAVVVVAANGVVGVLHGPAHARGRIWSVVDEVSQAEADVVRFLNRGERRPVGVDVGHNENSQGGVLKTPAMGWCVCASGVVRKQDDTRTARPDKTGPHPEVRYDRYRTMKAVVYQAHKTRNKVR